ncbi:MAG: hypothetical protein U1E65_34905 [Myxococcota bacterium]
MAPLGSTQTVETPVGTPPKKVGIFQTDAVEAQKASLEIKSAKPASLSGPEVAGATVRSEFPLQDLGAIATTGRYAQGFRLDGGSLRLMWMNARRVLDKNGKPGFEIFFQAQGATIENFRKRLEQAGAKSGSYKFSASDIEEPTPGKAVAKQNTTEWGPSSQSTINLSQEGKWSVDMVTTSPEAIKGAFRIKVYGDDAESTAALQEVIKKLGLQSVFAPPSPNALERFKILRFMWQVSPGAADHLRFTTLPLLKEALPDAVNLAEPDPAQLKAVDEAKFTEPGMKERAQLGELLFEKSPKAYLDWVKNVNPLTTTSGSDPNSGLKSALKTAGIAEGGEAWTAALAKTPDEESARALLELGVLAKKSASAAEALIMRDLETVKVSELHEALKAVGIDPTSDRVKNLRYEEVYPGYFTVVDPSLPDMLKEKGARYLYSTADNPERVWTMLMGGQKSSLTRFQEGLIIQGKSSDSDFNSGGATSVFSRLVPESIIQKAKQDKSAPSSYGDTSFYDWGGSRPFKLILNRRILARTDWYAYNGDNFGRTTTLKPENHGERIISTINASFSRSNEVMFPIGNDPSYVDFVVAPSEEKKKELVEFLTGKGITEFNGKKVEDFVIVRTKLFEHPDDMTMIQSVKDALFELGFQTEVNAARDAGRAAAETAIKEQLPAVIEGLLATTAKQKLGEQAASSAGSRTNSEASSAVKNNTEGLASLNLAATDAPLLSAATPIAEASLTKNLADPSNYTATWSLDSAVRSAANAGLPEAVAAVAAEVIAKEVAQAQPTAETTRAAVRASLLEAITAAVEPVLRAHVAEKGSPAGLSQATGMVDARKSTALNTAQRDALDGGAVDGVLKAMDAAALKTFSDAAAEQVRAKATESLKSDMNSYGQGWLRSGIEADVKAAGQKIALEVAQPVASEALFTATKESAENAAQKALEAYQTAYPDKVTEADKAQVPGVVSSTISGFLTEPLQMMAVNVTNTALTGLINAAVETIKQGPLFGEVAADLVAQRADAAVAEALKTWVKSQVTDKLKAKLPELLEATYTKTREQVAAQVLEGALKRTGDTLLSTQLKTVTDGFDFAAALDAIMAKVPPAPPPPPAETPPSPPAQS